MIDKKVNNKKAVIGKLDVITKNIIKNIISKVEESDPFNVKEVLINTIDSGDISQLIDLQTKIQSYFLIFNEEISNLFVKTFQASKLLENSSEYKSMLGKKLELSSGDIIYIEEIINENTGRNIKLKRDNDNNIIIYLGDTELLGTDRNDLHLSTGEQNFISLSFELIKAKNSDRQIIVLDDPISSFDSIYKNKISFAILKILESKNQIIFTHNLDLVRLLEGQRSKCFNLYLFNNVEGEENGFIHINEDEKFILLYINKLLDLLRNNIYSEIVDEKMFLISITPFMRGYANLIDDKTSKNELTKIMHGYNKEKVNITQIYNNLFGKDKLKTLYELSAEDIINLDLDDIKILKTDKYPLLNRTLKHTLTYLYLRLNVEKKICELYPDETKNAEQLGDIIFKAFKNDSIPDRRIFFTSKKTLLNEFNHFDGNMNIFQPAIDITDTALINEKKDILGYLNSMK